MDYLKQVGSGFKTLEDVNREKLRLLNSGAELVELSMINPDIQPARLLVDKLLEYINKTGTQRYSSSRGIRKFRNAVAQKYSSLFGISCDPDKEICCALGSKDAVLQILQATNLRNGAGVLLPAPCYPAHLSSVELLKMRPYFFSLDCDEAKMLDGIECQLKNQDIQLILLNFPCNPTGQSVSLSFYEKLLELAHTFDCLVVNDFVYGEMSFSKRPATSLLEVTSGRERALEVYSMSKAYCVPGWRMGAVLGAERWIERIARLKSLVDYGAYLPLQLAAASALAEGPELVEPVVTEYHRRSQIFQALAQELGLEHSVPSAGCSFWLKVPDNCFGQGAKNFCLNMIKSHGISLLPGDVFGEDYDSWVRIALVASIERLQIVADKLRGEIHSYEKAA